MSLNNSLSRLLFCRRRESHRQLRIIRLRHPSGRGPLVIPYWSAVVVRVRISHFVQLCFVSLYLVNEIPFLFVLLCSCAAPHSRKRVVRAPFSFLVPVVWRDRIPWVAYVVMHLYSPDPSAEQKLWGVLSLQHLSQRLIIDAFILSWRSPRLEFELSCSVAPRSFSGVRVLSQRSIGDAFILSWRSPRLEFRLSCSVAPRSFSGVRVLSHYPVPASIP